MSLSSDAPFLGDPVCLGEFSADFLLLSSSLAMETRRSKPMLISSRHLLASSGADPSPEDEAGLEGFLPGVGDTRGEAGRFLDSSTARSGVWREDLELVLLGRDCGMSGELNLAASPSVLVVAFSFSK